MHNTTAKKPKRRNGRASVNSPTNAPMHVPLRAQPLPEKPMVQNARSVEKSGLTGTLTIENSKFKAAQANLQARHQAWPSSRGSSYAAVLKPGLIEMTPEMKSIIFEDPIQFTTSPIPMVPRNPPVPSVAKEPVQNITPETMKTSTNPEKPAPKLETTIPMETDESAEATGSLEEPPSPAPPKDSFIPGFLASQLDEHTKTLRHCVSSPGQLNQDEEPAMDEEPAEEVEEEEYELHPLETAWTWYHMNGATRRKGADWNASIQTVGVFDTVEAFFRGFRSMPRPTETARQQDYMFFRGGKGPNTETPVIRAAWEDSKNAKGGMWRYSIPMRGKHSTQVDFYWKEILMALIGEQFGDYNDTVNGCYFCNRGDEHRFQVWMGNNEPGAVLAVGTRLAQIMNLLNAREILYDYCSHKEMHDKGNRNAMPLHDQQEIVRQLERLRTAA